MVSIYLILDAIAAFALLSIGWIVVIKNPRQPLNRVFFLFAAASAAWIMSNYFSNDQALNISTVKLANHLTLFFSSLAIMFLLKFVITIVPMPGRLQKIANWLFAIGIVSSALALTSLVMKNVIKQGNVYALDFGHLVTVYFAMIFIACAAIVLVLVYGIKKSFGLERSRLNIILWSLIASVAIALITNSIIPVISGSFVLTNIGPIATLIAAAGLTYSIIRHKLFDIRVIIARSVAYIASIVFLSALYTSLAFIVLNATFFKNDKISISQTIVFALLAVFLIFTFQPLKKFFDTVSNKLFYRDAYSPQVVIDTVNSTIVNSVDLHKLLEGVAKVIKENLKVAFCNFYIDSNDSVDFHAAGTDPTIFVEAKWLGIKDYLAKTTDKSVVFSEMTHMDNKINKITDDLNLEAIIRMSTSGQDVGQVIVGKKQSGNVLSQQDVQILEIIADEVAIAVQNALQFEEISHFNITLQKKVDDATAELKKTNEKLRALDEAKDEFISMASHQLRTPLTSVKGYISMLIEGDAGKTTSTQKEFLNQAFLSSQRMVYLIADLLNVSRLKTGKFVIESKPTYLPDVVEGELSQLTETAKSRGLEIIYDKPKSFPSLNLDETKVRQVIMNFADNAIYYTPKGGRITVKLEANKDSIDYTVTDTGIGVPKSEQHHLFTKFYRAGNARKARPDGTGLGLFMAKKVVVAQGGSIIFKTVEGKGSTFGFSFPRSKIELKTTAPAKKEPISV